jgi:uncharacterized protein
MWKSKWGDWRRVAMSLFLLACLLLFATPITIAAHHAHQGFDHTLLTELFANVQLNLLKPLLLFFLVGLAIPLLKIDLEFPYAIYQGLTIYLLISIGWHGGEELAVLPVHQLLEASAFMFVGFMTNTVIGFLAYFLLRKMLPQLRRVDAATVSGYYGSDSAGTFLACMGTLQAAKIAFAPYMPVMLAVMEIPGCLVGLFLVSRLRKHGMNKEGLMPDERDPAHEAQVEVGSHEAPAPNMCIWREVFLNPGLFLLMSGIVVGYISRLQGASVVKADDRLFVELFQGLLCIFLLEMGMTAAKRMADLRDANWRFAAFALLAPNVFACIGLTVCHLFSTAIGARFELGTYVLFAVLCSAASYIAVPAVQRLAIPEASPTLPLAASLGVTFVYNVTLGIPIYMFLAKHLV